MNTSHRTTSIRTLVLGAIIFLVVQVNLSAQYSLTIGDPRNSWYLSEGTITQASLNVVPKGLFMDYDLFLEFSSDGSPWNDVSDTLEVVLQFILPEEAVVYDSWLWIEGEPVQAEILDKWTASLIYESIVKRRRDPSILSKQSATRYELRVFPMAGNETRKVKISYMMPVNWNRQMVSAMLPTPIIHTSAITTEQFDVVVQSMEPWGQPTILQHQELEFDPISDTTLLVTIPGELMGQELEIGFEPTLENGLYFSKYQDGNNGIYQLALFPSDLLDTVIGNKLAVLIDFDGANTELTVSQLMETTRNEMLKTLTSRDSFNLVLSGLSPSRYSDQWEAASGENIQDAFETMSDQLADYSNLGSLIAEGVEFIEDQGGDGSIVLVADADQYDDFKVANNLIQDILSMMTVQIPIHIADFQSSNYHYYWSHNHYYMGNEYFYMNLAKQTGGSYQRFFELGSLGNTIGLALKYSGGSINAFDLHTGMENGYCHSRYLIRGNENRAYINDAILQIGKFAGEFPLELELSGAYNDQVFSKTLFIDDAGAIRDDTIAEEMWTGQYIRDLESQPPSNDVVNEIIYKSLTERVLSRYTSFLCLEQDFVYDPDQDPEDQFEPVKTEDVEVDSDTLSVYPNPFVDFLTIELECTRPGSVSELSLYSLTGSLVYRFDAEQVPVEGRNVYTWNGCGADGHPVAEGMYLLVYQNGTQRKTIKVVKH